MKPGEKIAQIRKAKGLSQRALSDRAEISHSTLAAFESGKRGVSLAVMQALSVALEAPELLSMYVKSRTEVDEAAPMMTVPIIDSDEVKVYLSVEKYNSLEPREVEALKQLMEKFLR